MKKAYEDINKISKLSLPLLTEEDTKLHKLMQFKFEQPSYTDPEFSDLNKYFYEPVSSQRMPLIRMQQIDPSNLRPSNVLKQLKKKSALLASIVSIIRRNKEVFKEMVYPRMPDTKIPIYNPYGKYIIRLYVNGAFRQVVIDDYIHLTANSESTLTFFQNSLDFYFPLINKAFQKLKFLGYRLEKDPSIYNWMMMGPEWIPERVLFSPVAEKFQQNWDLIQKATTLGTLIVRKKPTKDKTFVKRVFYNVHDVMEIDKAKILVMQNASRVDGDKIPDEYKLQLIDFDNNVELYTKIMQQFQDKISDTNGIFITSYKRFLENFDYGYINWRADTVIPINNPMSMGSVINTRLFGNVLALHRKDTFVVTSDFKFVSIASNPQFRITINEPYKKTTIWILLEWHTTNLDYKRQLSFNVHPKRASKISIIGSQTSMIQKNFKKHFGQRYVLGKVLLDQQYDGNEVALVLTNHTHSKLKWDIKEDVPYSLYFYSINKLKIEELENDLIYQKSISSALTHDISAYPTDPSFPEAPQFSLRPHLKGLNHQRFHFLIYLNSKESPLSFNIYDTTHFDSHRRGYNMDYLYTSNKEFTKFDFFEGEFVISTDVLSKFNLQIVPMFDKAPANSEYDITVYSNLEFDFVKLPLDEELFATYELKGLWNNFNAGGSGPNFTRNPKYIIQLGGNSYVRIRIHCIDNPDMLVNASLYECPFHVNEKPNFDIFSPIKATLSTNQGYTNEAWKQISDFKLISKGNYMLIPSTFEEGKFGKIQYIISNIAGKYIVKLYVQKEVPVVIKGHDIFS